MKKEFVVCVPDDVVVCRMHLSTGQPVDFRSLYTNVIRAVRTVTLIMGLAAGPTFPGLVFLGLL
jgi:hypothetical protein